MNYKRVVGKHNLTYQYRIPTVNIYKAMQEIGNGLEDKSLINIVGACFEVKVFDKALGIYYNSVHTFEDEFSIRISESDVSNIDGGLGIFGTYVSEKFNIEITPEFITSYGYTTAP